jgi:phospholipid/cholesterol/gamma-HCH transport system ATP-binding protein
MLNLDSTLAIRLRDLEVSFDDEIVISGLDLEVPAGNIFGLVGASGAGKSVLLRAVLGLIPKREGAIEIFGLDRDAARPQELRELERHWGVLYQQGALFSSLTVLQNIEFPMREYLDLSASTMREIALTKLEMVGLGAEDGDKFPAALSGGMTKRAALARALALDPHIVFLDEPTSGLDPIAAQEFDALIRTLHETLGFTVFMITHDLESLRTLCDGIAALADGKIAAVGTLETMLASQHPWVRAYFAGHRGRSLLAKVTVDS